VIDFASSDARKSTASQTSSGGMNPGKALWLFISRSQLMSAGSSLAAVCGMGVSMPPGDTQLTRTRCSASSIANERIASNTPALLAQYIELYGWA